MKIVITSASGVEAVTKRELNNLGYTPSPFINGRCYIEGDFFDVARLNISLYTAGRIEIELGAFKAENFDELFDNLVKIEYEKFLDKNAKIVISAKSVLSKLYALSAIQSISKKAVCSRLEKFFGTLNESGSIFRLEVALFKDIVTVSLNTSGDGLHKRGYRTLVGEAPLKETLASAMVMLSVWNKDRPLVDLFCGSGTILIEAVRIALKIPSTNRDFDFLHWNCFDMLIFEQVKSQAESQIIKDSNLKVYGYDIEPEQIKLAKYHAKKAGVASHIEFINKDMGEFTSNKTRGVIITNPPYGERLCTRKQIVSIYKAYGRVFNSLNDWSAYTLTSVTDFENLFGKKCKKRKLYNGKLECNYYTYLAVLKEKTLKKG